MKEETKPHTQKKKWWALDTEFLYTLLGMEIFLV